MHEGTLTTLECIEDEEETPKKIAEAFRPRVGEQSDGLVERMEISSHGWEI